MRGLDLVVPGQAARGQAHVVSVVELGRLAQLPLTPETGTPEYLLGDALGSVRQLTDPTGAVTLSKSYDPYGTVSMAAGTGQTDYGFTDEYQDSYTKLIYLRARLYSPSMSRFLTRDTWSGDESHPMSYNAWLYGYANPLTFVDPTGHYNRYIAVSWAKQHDLMDSFEEGEPYREVGTDCTAFASSVLWRGGIRDPRPAPSYQVINGQRYYENYIDASYWNGNWAESGSPFSMYKSIDNYRNHDDYDYMFNIWSSTPHLLHFLLSQTISVQYTVQNDEKLAEHLHSINFDKGDLVFYGTSHVAVVVNKWAPQTFFSSFSSYNKDYQTWTDYLKNGKDLTGIEDALTGEALNVWRATRCDAVDLPWLPRVVERSGAILYHDSRSIDNTSEPQSYFTIVHIVGNKSVPPTIPQ